MPKTRVVQQGEHLSSIAALEGFANYRTIWDFPENAALKSKRDPHVLFPGDTLVIPDREEREETRATDAEHPFQTEILPLFLRCKLLDVNGKPIAKAVCHLSIDGEDVADVTTDGEGILEQRIGRLAKTAKIAAELPAPKPAKPDEEPPPPKTAIFDVRIGSLNPETKFSGQQARLNNMGYHAGFSVKDMEQLLWAAEEFECDQTKLQVQKRPVIVPAPKDGEESAENADTESKTGIQDQAIVARIKKVHGF